MLLMRSTDADAEATETQVWLDFARDRGHLSAEKTEGLLKGYEEIGRMLGRILTDPLCFRHRG